ncbi:hypothetical protein [Microbacterium sp. NPDC089696]|uniref:hypothetical protein n=1 Tax=Microbacterium sp. NPDC089696 TaxID=3364199 RepID=UPI0037F1A97A
MEILRLAGGPGVGKSAVAWIIAQRLRSDGIRAGYVDIDQLGMCYPAPEGDPDRWALKERVLARVARGFAATGAATLVVSGVAETRFEPPAHGYPATSVWLDAAESVRRSRLAVRDWAEEQVTGALAAGTAESADAHTDWRRVPTDDLTADEVADRVIAEVEGSDDPDQAAEHELTGVSRASGSVLWITGPRLVGASTVGWRIASERWAAGLRTGFADAAQLAFAPDAPGLALAGVVALHESFAEVGAEALVVVAPATIAPAEVTAAFPHADVAVVRLDADEASRRARSEQRRAGGGPLLAGDDVAGSSDVELEELLAASGAGVGAAPEALVVDTSGLEADASADAVRAALAADGPWSRSTTRS